MTGARCPECAVVTYPAAAHCPRCGTTTEPSVLSSHGTVWSWTVQRHPPKSPPYVLPENGFRPFGVVYVELPEGIRVEAVVPPLDGVDPGTLRIGDPVQLSGRGGVPVAELLR
ncbi:DNA-binding protein [Nakamurella sp. YIM 132087]|uniref:DNA-binding protein n=1 Tax=Nakamurella alba TaxID=2665158 RepID=A0A7K1FSY3_9ACTN|nr:DNA-binding protein [Nakamurella alba]